MELRVLHIITSLAPDGAQQMLLKVLNQLQPADVSSAVINLAGPAPLSEELRTRGIPVSDLNLGANIHLASALPNFIRAVRSFGPTVVQGWMYHGNLAALAARRVSANRARLPVAWNIRRALYNIKDDKPLTRTVIRCNARLSKRAQAIVYCADICASQHEALGFSADRRAIIYNGFDTERFQPSLDKRTAFRQELGIDGATPLVCVVGRYHPQKDYPTFIEAAGRVAEALPEVRFVLVGRGVSSDNSELIKLAAAAGVAEKVFLLGPRQDIPNVLAGCDLFCLSSRNEGFPNVVGEAMATGLPCVVTDAGGAGEIVRDIGEIVPREDAPSLAMALERMLRLPQAKRASLGQKSRERICEKYSIAGITETYRKLYQRLAESGCNTCSPLNLEPQASKGNHG